MLRNLESGGSASMMVLAQMQQIEMEQAEMRARELSGEEGSPGEMKTLAEQRAARKEQLGRFLNPEGSSLDEGTPADRDARFQLVEKVVDDVSQDKLSDDEMDKLFGDQAGMVRDLMKSRDDVKLSDLMAFRGDQSGLSSISKLLTDRKDLGYNDLVSKSPDGKVSLTWAVGDEKSKEIMDKRRDIKPKELTSLFGMLVKSFDNNPRLAKQAYDQTARLLINRPDISPDAAGKMVLEMGEQLKPLKPDVAGGQQMLDAARLDMLGDSVDLLIKRSDIGTDQVTQLSGAMAKSFGNKKDPLSLSRVSHSFKDATEMLGKRNDVSVDQVTGFLGSLDSAIPGSDTHSLENKASILRGTCEMLGRKPDVSFDSMQSLLEKSRKESGPDSGASVLFAFRRGLSQIDEGKEPVSADAAGQPKEKDDARREEKAGEKGTGASHGEQQAAPAQGGKNQQ